MKKKKIIIACVILAIVAGISTWLVLVYKAGTAPGNVDNVNRKSTGSEVYSDKDIEEAMDVAEKYFKENFEGCTLTDLWYDEKLSVGEDWGEPYGKDESIVLYSNYDVGPQFGNVSLNANTTYSEWKWILLRNKGEKWKFQDGGYGSNAIYSLN